MATVSQWTPFGVSLNLTATGSNVVRTSATEFSVSIAASWKTYWSGNKTNYGMSVSTGNQKDVVISSFGTKRESGSKTFTAKYSISGNGSATKAITVTFKNYNTDNGDSATKSVTFNVTVPAWTSYKVTYNANGGTGAPTAQTKWKDQNLTLSTTKPTRTGYSFLGWSTSSSATTATYAAGATFKTNANTTLYAIWKANTYVITYNANGGAGAPSNQTKTYGVTLTLSTSKPTRTGYSFKHWNTKADGSGRSYASGASFASNEATTLYAVWQANTYTVTYDANGGTGAPSSQTKTYGIDLKLSNTAPTRANYNFLGWSTSKTATTAAYTAGSTYSTNASLNLYAVWELAYVSPKITNLQITRYAIKEGSGYVQTDNGNYAAVKFNWSTSQEVTSISIKWTAIGESEVEHLIKPAGKEGYVSPYLGNGELKSDKTYTFVITVSDTLGSTTVRKTLPGARYVMDLLAGGTGIAFGKPAELPGVADFDFETRMRKPLFVDNNTAFNGHDPDGTLVEFLNPVNGSGNIVLGYGNYDRGKGNTNVYGYDVHLGVSNIASPGTYRPYRRQGDSINFTLRTAGYVTNASKDVTFTVPFAVPIVGSPTVTVSSLNGFILRQGANYTHGSTASVYVVPDSYEATVSQWMGVTITAKFSNTTNVTNNDAIGIYWNGTITFS